MEQVIENMEIAGRSVPGTVSEENLEVIGRVREAYRSLRPISCSQCSYCMPCPNGVAIPTIFQLYNNAVMYDDMHMGRMIYTAPFGPKENERADNCTECGECMEKCPQNVEISGWLKKEHTALMPEG